MRCRTLRAAKGLRGKLGIARSGSKTQPRFPKAAVRLCPPVASVSQTVRGLAAVVAGVAMATGGSALGSDRGVTGPLAFGTRYRVNSGPGDQTDGHVSGDWVAYTAERNGGTEVRYHNLVTGTDTAVPG